MRRRDDRGHPLLMQPKTQRHSSGEIDRAVIKSWQNMRVEIEHGQTESPPLLKKPAKMPHHAEISPVVQSGDSRLRPWR
jgi:hypothetical protein